MALNDSVDMKEDRTIKKGPCGDQAALTLAGIEDSPAAPANRPGVIPAGAGYAGQRGGTVVYDSGYPLIR